MPNDVDAVTCRFCHATLSIERTETAAFTRELRQIGGRTDDLEQRLTSLEQSVAGGDRRTPMQRLYDAAGRTRNVARRARRRRQGTADTPNGESGAAIALLVIGTALILWIALV